MICVRSSFDSGRGIVRLTKTRPMDFVSALMGVRRKRAAAGQLFVSNTVWRRSNRHEASFAQGGSYRLSEDAHLGRLEILSTSVSDGHPEHRSRSVARTQKLSPADIFANSMILSKNVFLSWGTRQDWIAGAVAVQCLQFQE